LSRWRYEAIAVAVFIAAAGLFLFFARRMIDRALIGVVEAASDGNPPDEP
jgi:HAMP domain-containing protein